MECITHAFTKTLCEEQVLGRTVLCVFEELLFSLNPDLEIVIEGRA